MLIQVRTDDNIEGRDELASRVESRVGDALEQLADRVTRVQVHLGDENSDKKSGPDDKRCTLEVRLAGLEPVVAHGHAPDAYEALEGAIERAVRSARKAIDRKRDLEREG